jgi:tetratricopeptide (TPR) repeat protein
MLDRAFDVNPWHPRAWAYRAVVAHLKNDSAGEKAAREKAFKFWETNPEVDYLIGLKLSQNYRFAEGSACQRRALGFDPAFLPARNQLAEDLLRLGEEAEGWSLADEVHRRDGYDVTAYNLVTLHDTMRKFRTLTNEDFVLRMGPQEAALYGDRALALLSRARSNLTRKYGIALERPTIVEIFPEQKDFAVRTFGMPGNPGFLGVCFGRVVTANSPASQGGNPANWEAVLWHEFCHVVTLQLTKNKMPRWLSEGISVYEELQANPAWGQRMNPQYRELALGDDLTPVSELSSAFLSPKSDLHLQFAYYESALVVEYLVGKFGSEKLRAILRDLGDGANINDSIPRHTAPMKQIEKEFAAFAKKKAEALGPGLDWEKPEGRNRRGDEADTFFDKLMAPLPHVGGSTNNYWVLMEQAAQLVREKKWAEAKAPLAKLIELCPDQAGPGNAYAMLGEVHRSLNETNQERAVLEKWAERDADVPDAYFRLMELAESAKDWEAVARNSERFLAVNPLVPQPYRALARASEELGKPTTAINAYEKLVLLDPADPADVHFRLARLLHMKRDPAAKRHVLMALEEAPRFREAHRLLLELAQASETSTNAPVVAQ